MKPIGYLTNTEQGLHGDRGLYYDYIFASNGVFIEAEGEFMAARVCVREAEIRGLAPLSPVVVLRHGLIPQHLFDLILNYFLANWKKEIYAAVVYDMLNNKYGIVIPPQAASEEQLRKEGNQGQGGSASVAYYTPEKVVVDLHSHGDMTAAFSSQDNRDEQGLKIYGVIGNFLREEPVVNLRVGVYGYFQQVKWDDIFDGILVGAADAARVKENLQEDEARFHFYTKGDFIPELGGYSLDGL